MILRFRVSHIFRADRANPNSGILLIGAVRSQIGSWAESPTDAARLLRAGLHSLYLVHEGVEIEVKYLAPARTGGQPSVRSAPDRHGRDLLLSLPEFEQDCFYAKLPRMLPPPAQASSHGLGTQNPR